MPVPIARRRSAPRVSSGRWPNSPTYGWCPSRRSIANPPSVRPQSMAFTHAGSAGKRAPGCSRRGSDCRSAQDRSRPHQENRVVTRLTGDGGKNGHWTRSTRPATINARFIDRLPYERNGDRKPVCLYTTTARQRPCLLPSADLCCRATIRGTLVIKRPRTMHQTPGPVSGGKGPKIVPVS
jgi:hypothetical protein